MIDVAVIGAGAISSFHLDGYRAFPDRCRIVAVADTDVARARQRIAEYGLADAVAFDGVDAVLNDGRNVDLASVCTPPGSHAEIAVRLLDADVAALLEKPMAPPLAECDAILAAADRGDDVLTALETTNGTRRVPVDGREGRKTIEIITAIYQAAITAQTVPVPLAADDPFRTRDGLLAAAPRFHDKTVSVGQFETNEITT